MVEHDLYEDSAILKKIENGYLVIMSASNTDSNRNESYDVETHFKDFKDAWNYLSKVFDGKEYGLGHTVRIETGD